MTELVASLVLRLVDQWSSGARAAQRGLGNLERAAGGFGQAGSVAARNAQRLAGASGQVAGASRSAVAAQAALSAATGVASAASQRLAGASGQVVGASRSAVAAQAALSAATGVASGASQRLYGARTAEALATTSGTRAAEAAAKAQAASARSTTDAAQGAERAASAQNELASSTTRAGEAAEGAYRRFSRLERMQFRGSAAGRAFRDELGTLQGRLAGLGMASFATGAMQRTADAVNRPMQSSVERSADFNERLAGIRIDASLKAKDLPGVASNAYSMAQDLGSPMMDVMDDHGAVLNESVYNKSPRALELATRATAATNRPASTPPTSCATSITSSRARSFRRASA